MNEENFEEEKNFLISDKISDLENYYADNILTEELKELYAKVQNYCKDFRDNIFFKNVDLIQEQAVRIILIYLFIFQGTFDKEDIYHTFDMGNVEEEVKEIQLLPELLVYYANRVKDL